MKKQIHKISGKVEELRNDKRVVVFLVCVLFATMLWFLNALSKDYTTTISYPVKYVNAPKSKFLSNAPPSNLELKVQAHGFTLLRHKLNLSFSPIVLNLTNITRNIEPGTKGYNINTGNLLRKVSDQVSNEISITEIRPEYILVRLDSLITKTVPVKADIELQFKPQFDLKEPVSLAPQKVEITGPAGILDTIFYLQTEKRLFDKLDTEVVKLLDVLHPEKTKIKPGAVNLKIPVEKFTEKEIRVPVQVINLPAESNIKLFPSAIKLTVLVGLSQFEQIDASGFKVVVDYNQIEPSTESLKVSIEAKPSTVQIQRHSPEKVEFLIETN